jgi:uncharacterized integral membrane protein
MWFPLERVRRSRRSRSTGAPSPTEHADSDGGVPAPRGVGLTRTRVSGTWVAALITVITLVLALIFVLQNPALTSVYFLGLSGSLPVGVAMLFAALAGALLIALPGSARILQLRRSARRRNR